jgi:hypothetical protein
MTRLLRVSIVPALFCVFASLAMAETKSGPITLKESKFGDDAAPTVTLGHKIKVSCNFHITDFFGENIIAAGATLKNSAAVPMFYSYNVAFFDEKHNLVGCACQGSMNEGLKPGEETQLGSCLIDCPADVLAKVKTYQVTFYEAEKKIGAK